MVCQEPPEQQDPLAFQEMWDHLVYKVHLDKEGQMGLLVIQEL